MKKPVVFKDLGLIEYKNAWDLQEKIFKAILADKKK